MITILIKDKLRQSVEVASGGLRTVLYTTKGQPTFMNIVEKFLLSDIDVSLPATVHPAFIINGVEKDKIFVGTYEAVVRNGELLSIQNEVPTNGLTINTFAAYAKASGTGFHMITNAEWSAIALKAFKNDTQPLGNTYFGRSIEDATKYGKRADGLSAIAGITSGNPITLNGSGPVAWNDNQKYNGISDLSGNLSEFCAGLRLINRELQVIPNNNAAYADTSATSTEWRAINAITGEYVALGSANTVKIAKSGTDDYTLVYDSSTSLFSSITNPGLRKVSDAALNVLKSLLLFPMSQVTGSLGSDTIETGDNTNELICLRSRNHWSGTKAGIFQLSLNDQRSFADRTTTRLAYYTP